MLPTVKVLNTSEFYSAILPAPFIRWAKGRYHDFIQTLEAPFKGPTNYRYKGPSAPGDDFLKHRFVYIAHSGTEALKWGATLSTIAAIGAFLARVSLFGASTYGSILMIGSLYELACYLYDYRKRNTLEQALTKILSDISHPLPVLQRSVDPSKPFSLTAQEIAGDWKFMAAKESNDASASTYYLFKTEVNDKTHIFAYYFGNNRFVPTPWFEEEGSRVQIKCSNCLDGAEIEPLLRLAKPHL